MTCEYCQIEEQLGCDWWCNFRGCATDRRHTVAYRLLQGKRLLWELGEGHLTLAVVWGVKEERSTGISHTCFLPSFPYPQSMGLCPCAKALLQLLDS